MTFIQKVILFISITLVCACGGSGGGGAVNRLPNDRPRNLTCIAPEAPTRETSVQIAPAFPSIPVINQPTKLLLEPNVTDPRWFVLSKTGDIIVINAENSVTRIFLSLEVNASSEGGLLGLAFHPDYPAVPEIFLYYTVDGINDNALLSVISRVKLDDISTPSDIGNGTIEQIILTVDQFAANHNGGDINFGNDRFLYVGLGDGGGAGDPEETAQDNTRLLGALLRIDVLDTEAGYNIPTGNPFARNEKCGPSNNTTLCPEIYAWGFRNPFRWTFDDQTSALWAADVGQGAREEINEVVRGGNYGWDCREGSMAYEPNNCSTALIDPVHEYDHANGDRSVTGGLVYRGTAIPSLSGRYIFGDFSSGRLWALNADATGQYERSDLASVSPAGITAFATDSTGEIYFTHFSQGVIYKILPTDSDNISDNVAIKLSASGCVQVDDTTQPYEGLIPYQPAAQFWSDGATKDRYIALPENTNISISENGNFVFPTGTVLVKNFSLNGVLIETRHLMRHTDGSWGAYTYEWNQEQTEATRVFGGKSVSTEGQTWIYPSTSECFQCHTTEAGVVLGAEVAQLNNSVTYTPSSISANQLTTMNNLGLFDPPLATTINSLPSLAAPEDQSQSLNERARAYLHTNCAQCHLPNGPTQSDLDLRYGTALADTNACDETPKLGDVGIDNPAILAPGQPSQSVLLARMNRRGAAGMPPIASTIVDSAGVALIRQWIDSLANCLN